MQCIGKKEITWRSKDGRTGVAIVSCGSCVPCLLRNSNEWALRCALEYSLCDVACCLTLTVDDEHIDIFSEGVNRREIQLFIKRVRRSHPVRYFGCGEYGSIYGRPHYHVILFGWMPEDKRYFKRSKSGHPIYVSAELSKIWTYGFATIEDFNESTAVYCSKYLNKIKPPLPGKIPPFTFMSLKPSIGILAVKDEDFERGYLYHKGVKRAIPRSFYLSLKRKGIDFPELAASRLAYVKSIDDDELYLSEVDSSRKTEIMLDKLRIL